MRKWKIYSFNMCPALFYKLPILFSRVKLTFPSSFIDPKLEFLNVDLRLHFQNFLNSKRFWKLGFLNVALRWVRLSIWEGIFQKKFILLRWKFLSGFLVVSVFLSISFDNGWEDFLPVQSSYFRNFGAKTLGTYNPSHIPQVVVETTVSDETAFNSNWLFAKVPLLSHFMRLWG